MSKRALRSIILMFHIVAASYNAIAIYSPLHDWPPAFSAVQWVSFPMLVITGMLMVRVRRA